MIFPLLSPHLPLTPQNQRDLGANNFLQQKSFQQLQPLLLCWSLYWSSPRVVLLE